MEISIVIANGVKQVMMTPETEVEKQALNWITPWDVLEAVIQKWTYDDAPSHFSYQSRECQWGHLRRFATKDSLMFVIRDKQPTETKQPEPTE